MSEAHKKVTEQDVNSAKQALDLLRSQVQSGHLDTDFLLRQIDKVQRTMAGLDKARNQQAAAGRFELLYNVSRILGTSLDLQTVLDQVMDGVVSLTGAERGFLMLRDDDDNLKVRVARNLDRETLGSEEFEYSRSISKYAIENGEAILTTNAQNDPRFANQASVMMQSLRSIMVAPMWARGRVIGIAYVENRVVAGLFSQEDLTTLEALTGQAAIAIDNAKLFSETDQALAQRIDQLQMLRRIDLQLNEQLEPDTAMLVTLEAACSLTDATSGHLGLITHDPDHVEAIHHFYKSGSKDKPINLDTVYPQVWEAVQTKRTITFDSGQYDLHSVLVAPIVRDDTVMGVVVLKREDGGSFSDVQQDLVERLMVRAAVTIENARLYAAVIAANQAKSEFVGIVAHDLKAPMTGISGYADLMLMTPDDLDERQTKYLKRIRNTVRRMEMLVQDLADISRIESGQFLMDERRVTVQSVVEAVNDTVMPQMKERQHDYKVDLASDLPQMWTDYYRLVQVLTNLLSNAYKYTPDGGQVTLKAWQAADRIHYSISDNGIGLSPEAIEKLGTKFWRAEDDYTRSQQGTGLGFAITSSLVEQMGSAILIESEEGHGSTFSFSVAVAGDE